MSKTAKPPLPPSLPGVPRQSTDDLSEGPSAFERAVIMFGTSFGASLLVHIAVLAMLAFWITHRSYTDLLVIDIVTPEPLDAVEISTVKLETAPASVPKDDVSPLTSNAAIEAASSSPPPADLELDISDVPGAGTVGGGSGKGIFGTGAGAKSFVFVVDCSSSMTGLRFQRAISELLRVVGKLRPNQQFFVVFYNHASIPMFAEQTVMNFRIPAPPKKRPNRRRRKGPTGRFGNALVRGVNGRNAGRKSNVKRLLAASSTNKRKAKQWILKMRPSGGTRPRDALQVALRLKPQVVYFLTDGDIPADTPDVIRQSNKAKTIVHTVALGNPGSAELLKRIATDNRGRYTFVE